MRECLREVSLSVLIVAQLHVSETTIEKVVAIETASKSTLKVLKSLCELSQFIVGLSCVTKVLL